MSDHLKGLLITGLGVLFIVPDSLMVRLIDADAVTIAFWRSVFVTLVLGLGVLIFAGPRGYTRVFSQGPLALVYAACIGGSGSLFVFAVANTSVANVVFIIASIPMFAAVFSWLLLGERVSARVAATIAVVALGIGVIAVGSGESEGAHWVGDLIALCVAMVFGLGLTAARKLRAGALVPMVPVGYFAAAILLFPFAAPLEVPQSSWLWVVLHGGVFISGATAFITLGPRYLPSAEVGLLILLESVLAPLLVWAVLGEDPGRWTLVGGAIVLFAMAVSNLVVLRRRAGT